MKTEIEPLVEPVHEVKANKIADLENYDGYRIARDRGWHFYEYKLEGGWMVEVDVAHSRDTGNTVACFNGRPVYASWPEPGPFTVPLVLTRSGWKRVDQLSCPEILLCCAADSPARAPKITEVPAEPKYGPAVEKPKPFFTSDRLILGVALGLICFSIAWVWYFSR